MVQNTKMFRHCKLEKIGISICANQMSFVVFSDHQKQIIDADCFVFDDPLESLGKIKKRVNEKCSCFLILPNHLAIIKRLHFVDSFTGKEIHKLLKLNAVKYFSYPIEQISYDYEYLDETQNYIRIAASKKENITNWARLFEKAALNLKVLTFDVLALENFFRASSLLEVNKIYAIILRQNNSLLQVIIDSAVVVFVNNIFLEDLSVNFYEELHQFVRLYETSTSNAKPIDEAIIISSDFVQDNVESYPKIRSTRTLLPNLQATSLLPWGAVL